MHHKLYLLSVVKSVYFAVAATVRR